MVDDVVSVDTEIRTTAVDFSFGELLNLHKDHEIIIKPEYQRLFRWSDEQRSRLIESILIGLPIPPIFLIEGDKGVLELIDGLQRTSSVLQFLDHEAIDQPVLHLTGCDLLKHLNGATFDDLPTVQKLKIKRTPIRATIINKSGNPTIKYEMFKRLNTGGSLLSAQEIRNCSSRMVDGGEIFYQLIQDLAASENFVAATARLPDIDKEKRANEELVLRFFALALDRSTFKGNIQEWLDAFMENVLFGRQEFNSETQKAAFLRCFDIIVRKFGEKAFSRFNDHGEPIGRLAPAYFEAVCATVYSEADTIDALSPEVALTRLQAAFLDQEFKSSTGPGANSIAKLAKRIETVTRHLTGNVAA